MPAYRHHRPRAGYFAHVTLGFWESEHPGDIEETDYRWIRGTVSMSVGMRDGATLVPTAPLTWSLTALVEAVPELAAGRNVTIEDVSHAWQVELHSHPAREIVTITQQMRSRYATLRDADVPLCQLLSESVRIAKEWRRWTARRSPAAAADDVGGVEYRRLVAALDHAQRALARLGRTH